MAESAKLEQYIQILKSGDKHRLTTQVDLGCNFYVMAKMYVRRKALYLDFLSTPPFRSRTWRMDHDISETARSPAAAAVTFSSLPGSPFPRLQGANVQAD